jgi:hypothetical protein
MFTNTDNWDVEKYGINFEVVIEGKSDKTHFALLKTKGNAHYDLSGAEDRKLDNFYELEFHEEVRNMLPKSQFYLMWGPKSEPRLEYHGLSPLRTDKNNSYKLSGAMAKFVEAVRNAKDQTFSFRKKEGYNRISINQEKYPNGRLY